MNRPFKQLSKTVLSPLEGLAGPAVKLGLDALLSTLRHRRHFFDPQFDPLNRACPGGAVYALWHRDLMLPIWKCGWLKPISMISQSKDGQLLNDVASRCGVQPVRGSSSKGARGALRAVIRRVHEIREAGQTPTISLTIDGPRGPAEVVKAGVTYMASRGQLPIVPVGLAYQSCWKLNSWDQFRIPKPFSLASWVFGPPQYVASDASAAELESATQHLQDQMEQMHALADHWLRHPSGRVPASVLLAERPIATLSLSDQVDERRSAA